MNRVLTAGEDSMEVTRIPVGRKDMNERGLLAIGTRFGTKDK